MQQKILSDKFVEFLFKLECVPKRQREEAVREIISLLLEKAKAKKLENEKVYQEIRKTASSEERKGHLIQTLVYKDLISEYEKYLKGFTLRPSEEWVHDFDEKSIMQYGLKDFLQKNWRSAVCLK